VRVSVETRPTNAYVMFAIRDGKPIP
jgi:hypothetical protein